MLVPGDLVIPRLRRGIKSLYMWSYDEAGPYKIIGEVAKNTVLTVVRIEQFNDPEERTSNEWKNGSCLLLCPSGITGWTGAGWLKKINKD
jgi:hypothetical protein